MAAAAFRLRTPRAVRSDIDARELERAWPVLAGHGQAVEVRGLPSGRSRIVPAGDLKAAMHAADDLSDGSGTYYTLNPVSLVLVGRPRCVRKADVVSRYWLLIDVDPAKPENHKDDSATDEEKEKARQLAQDVMDHLAGQGWPVPVFVDSGNGWHVLYRVDLPANDHSQALIRAVLACLSARFDGDRGCVDKAVHNAARIAKLPGTWARKGQPSEDRPHRPVRLVSVPDSLEVVSLELIEAAGRREDEPAPGVNGHGDPFRVHASNGDVRAYARKALEQESARIRNARPGPVEGRNNAYNKAVFNMAGLVAGSCILEQEVRSRLCVEASLVGLTDGEIEKTWQSAFEAGKSHPRRPGERVDPKPKADEKTGPYVILASAIKPRKVEWLWPGRIPLGKLTTFAGVGGLGKTFVLCDISARVSRGLDWPD